MSAPDYCLARTLADDGSEHGCRLAFDHACKSHLTYIDGLPHRWLDGDRPIEVTESEGTCGPPAPQGSGLMSLDRSRR